MFVIPFILFLYGKYIDMLYYIVPRFLSSQYTFFLLLVFIFFKYPPKHSLSYIAKRIKGSTSRILRKEFPHLKEWCGEHFWAPSCFHGSVGNGWEIVEKYIRDQDTYEYNREK
jgi:hypothetical protein